MRLQRFLRFIFSVAFFVYLASPSIARGEGASCQNATACKTAALEGVEACVNIIRAQMAEEGLDSAGKVTNLKMDPNGGSLAIGADLLGDTAMKYTTATEATKNICNAALEKCGTVCTGALKAEAASAADTSHGGNHSLALKSYGAQCKERIGTAYKMLTGKQIEGLGVMAKASEIFSAASGFVKENPGAVGFGAAAIGIGLLHKNGKGGGKKGDAKADKSGTEKSKDDETASNEIDCTTEENASTDYCVEKEENSKDCSKEESIGNNICEPTHIANCGADPTADMCPKFVAEYCKDEGKGDGSAFCAKAQAVPYCQNAARASSPSCTWLASMPYSCRTNPAGSECLPQYASREALASTCANHSSDPLCYAVLQKNLMVAGTAGGTGLTASAANPYGAKYGQTGPNRYGMDPRTLNGYKAEVAPMSVGRSPASVLPPDIKPSNSGNLISSRSQTTERICQNGQAQDCP